MEAAQKILCMYSGGIDSLGALYKLLTDPAYTAFTIHVHHMNLQNVENRMQAEHQAVQRTLVYLRKNNDKPFFYTECSHDYSFMRPAYFTFDTYWYGFMAANIITADPSIRYVATGRTKSDREGPAAQANRFNADRGLEIFHATLPLKHRFERDYIYPVAHLTKKEVWQMLPPELRKMAWSCRQPVIKGKTFVPCGRCAACKSLQKITDPESN